MTSRLAGSLAAVFAALLMTSAGADALAQQAPAAPAGAQTQPVAGENYSDRIGMILIAKVAPLGWSFCIKNLLAHACTQVQVGH